ncbi:hypothetical protein RZS08_44680, partial [Arthrospira platensis SPKY1]|nr:hypothetical protein [Arthrospira platensis SPKY1]
MAALGGQRHPALTVGDQGRHTEAGAGADETDHALGTRLAATDPALLVGRELGQRHRHRHEVI